MKYYFYLIAQLLGVAGMLFFAVCAIVSVAAEIVNEGYFDWLYVWAFVGSLLWFILFGVLSLVEYQKRREKKRNDLLDQ